MRATLCVLATISAVGCTKVKDAVREEALPAPTASYRVTDSDLYEIYRKGDEKHPREGQRVICKTYGSGCYGVTKGGTTLVLEGSNKLFQRPQIAFVLRDNRGFKEGSEGYPKEVYIEGILRGRSDFDSKSWAKEWATLTEDQGLKKNFILFEDAIFVSEPKGQ